MAKPNHISNYPNPWFDYILTGKKTFEGRLNRGRWADMQVDDIVQWTYGNRIIDTIVTEIKLYKSFKHAFKDLGEKLLPSIETDTNAGNLYSSFYSDEDVNKYGVVAIGIRVLTPKN